MGVIHSAHGGLDERHSNTILGHEHDEVATIQKIRVQPPRRYKVFLHNDDYTTMEFVVYILQKFFGKSIEEAQMIMLKVHKEGVGVCGVYTHEVAESKVAAVRKEAKSHGHPLKCSYEPE